jgi:hypothetical protein
VRQLPSLHAVAIRLRDDGYGDHVIAVALELDDDQVATLLQIADSKLSNLMALDLDSPTRTDRIDRPHAAHTHKSQDQGELS